MGLTSSLSTVLSGLTVTQRELDLVANNIANADTPGYTRKTLSLANVSSGNQTSIGVRVASVQREIDTYVQAQYRNNVSVGQYADIRQAFSSRLDQMFGTPGDVNALDTIYNGFTSSLELLAASPEDLSARIGVINDAQSLTQRLQAMTDEIQSMREEAEQGLADGVKRVNELLSQLETLNSAVVTSGAGGSAAPDLLDDRDRIIDELSTYMDIRTEVRANGSIAVMTNTGVSLFDHEANQLAFDQHGTLSPGSTWSSDPNERGVGTITLQSAQGYSIDLVADGAFRSGRLAGYLEVRDEIMVTAQAQLDEFASSMALALSNRDVDGTAVSVGAQDGFDIDLADVQEGNTFTLTYTDTGATEPQTFTFVRVDDPTLLPLDDGFTGRADDTVVGIDFSGGWASVASQIGTALGGSFTVSDQGSGVIRVLDDGAVGTIDITDASASVTAQALVDEDLSLLFFIDGGDGGLYTGSMEGVSQKVGFAGRIVINPDLVADNSRLVVFSTSPETPSGDSTRPNEILDRLTNAQFSFNSEAGIGTSTAPYTGDLTGFMAQIVSYQGSQAASLDRLQQGQQIITDGYQQRLEASSKVNVDQELARLVQLQTAYAANARIISAVQEMINSLLNAV